MQVVWKEKQLNNLSVYLLADNVEKGRVKVGNHIVCNARLLTLSCALQTLKPYSHNT